MSHDFKSAVIALLVLFSALGWGLAYLNGKQADELLRRELEHPCVAIPYSAPEARTASCFVWENPSA